MRRSTPSVLLLLGVALLARPLAAQPPEIPLAGSLRIELQGDTTHSRSSGGDNLHDLFVTLELGLETRLSKRWSVEAGVVLEPVGEFERPGDSILAAPGAFLETLVLRHAGGGWTARIGRLTPRFGLAWDAAAGLHGRDFAEDYELAERWGVEAAVDLGGEGWGSHELAVSAFALDTSPLSRSLLRDRGRTRRGDGGPGNTGRPDSFAVSLDGSGPGCLAGLRYRGAYVQQGRADTDSRREHGFSLGLEVPFSLPGAVKARGFVEHAWIRDAGGAPGDARYSTVSIDLTRGSWHGALAFAARRLGESEPRRDALLEVSAGYRFGSGLNLEVGWRGTREGGVEASGLGLRLSREFRVGG